VAFSRERLNLKFSGVPPINIAPPEQAEFLRIESTHMMEAHGHLTMDERILFRSVSMRLFRESARGA
jgi:hypothetical protein